MCWMHTYSCSCSCFWSCSCSCYRLAGWLDGQSNYKLGTRVASRIMKSHKHTQRHKTETQTLKRLHNPQWNGNLQAAKQAKLFCWFTKDKHNWITERAHGHGYEHGHVSGHGHAHGHGLWLGLGYTLRIRNFLSSTVSECLCVFLHSNNAH